MLNPENEQGVRYFYESLGFNHIENLTNDKKKRYFYLGCSTKEKITLYIPKEIIIHLTGVKK